MLGDSATINSATIQIRKRTAGQTLSNQFYLLSQYFLSLLLSIQGTKHLNFEDYLPNSANTI